MLKKTMILALAAMAVAAFVAPTASAVWTQHHKATLVNENPTVEFTGQAAFTSAVVGGIECQVDATVIFTGGTTTGHVEHFQVDTTEAGSTVTKKCVTSGPLAPCAVKSVQATDPTVTPWPVHSDGADTITITTGQIHNLLESPQGGACGVVQQVTLEAGTVHAQITPGETCTVKQVHLSGQLKTGTGANVQIHGTLAVKPSATYGTSTDTEGTKCV